MRAIYHIGFWLSFALLFIFQNPNGSFNDYLIWFWLLCVLAIVTYTNLYVLLPHFFYKKKYIKYVLLLLILFLIGSFIMDIGIVSDNPLLKNNFYQNFLNLFVITVFTSTIKFYRHNQARLIKVENEQLKTELKLLKAQINPHFLFNTLSNLYGLVIQNKNPQAAEVTLKLSDLMRYLLQSSKAEKVEITEEIQFLEDYLSLERIRLTQNADIQFTVTGIDSEVWVAPLLFIPFVENAFKHGLQSLTKDCYAHFTLAKQDNELFFEAKNSLGKHLNKIESGTGLENLKKRLELIYPEQHLLETEQTETYFKASLQISL